MAMHETAPRRRPRDRKATIVAASAELFADRGYAAVRVDDIGDRVGISGPAVYRHFPSKEAVLGAVLLDVVITFDDAASSAHDLRAMVSSSMHAALDRPAALGTYLRERPSLRSGAAPALEARERQLRRRWRDAIRAAAVGVTPADADQRALATLATIDVVARRRATMPRPAFDDLMTEALVAVLTTPVDRGRSSGPRRSGWSPPESRAEAILDAALALFRARGYHGVGVDDIGEAAGISGPTVYAYYGSKAEILDEAFDRAGARVTAGVHEALARASSAEEALAGLIASYVDVARDQVDLIVVTTREGATIPDEDRGRRSRQRRRVRDAWVGVLRELRPELSEGAARTLVAGVFPLVLALVTADAPPGRAATLAAIFLGVPSASR